MNKMLKILQAIELESQKITEKLGDTNTCNSTRGDEFSKLDGLNFAKKIILDELIECDATVYRDSNRQISPSIFPISYERPEITCRIRPSKNE